MVSLSTEQGDLERKPAMSELLSPAALSDVGSGGGLEVEEPDAIVLGLKETVQQLKELLGSRESELYSLQEELKQQERENREALQELEVQLDQKESRIYELRDEVEQEKKKIRDIWRLNCDQIANYDEECAKKDAQLEELRAELGVKMSAGLAPRERGFPTPVSTPTSVVEGTAARASTARGVPRVSPLTVSISSYPLCIIGCAYSNSDGLGSTIHCSNPSLCSVACSSNASLHHCSSNLSGFCSSWRC